MKRVVLIYGLIAGTIVAAMMFITMPMHENGTLNYDNGAVVGYTTMAVALSMIFFGVKSYRDNYAGGEISFWKGVKVGLLITAIAGVMYCLAWEISYRNMKTDYLATWIEHEVTKMQEDGATPAETEEFKATWTQFNEMYRNNPVIRFLMTLMEIVPVGLVITLITAGLLRLKTFLPAQPKMTNPA